MRRFVIDKKKLRVYLAALLLSFLWVSFYGGPFPYITFFAIILYIPVSLLWILLEDQVLLRMDMSTGSRKLTKGEETPLRIVMENSGFCRINNLKLLAETELGHMEGIDLSSPYHILPGKRIELEGSVKCYYAGVHEIGLTGLLYTDPFGLFTWRCGLPQPLRIQSIPRITDMADEFLSREDPGNRTGHYLSVLPEPVSGNDLRIYREGDSVRRVNWKVSAIRRELYLRKPEQKELCQVMIFLKIRSDDALAGRDMDAVRRRDWLLEFAVSAAAWFFRNGWDVCVYVPIGSVQEFRITGWETFRLFCNELSGPVFYTGEAYEKEMMEKIAAFSEDPDLLVMTVDETEQKVLWDNQLI